MRTGILFKIKILFHFQAWFRIEYSTRSWKAKILTSFSRWSDKILVNYRNKNPFQDFTRSVPFAGIIWTECSCKIMKSKDFDKFSWCSDKIPSESFQDIRTSLEKPFQDFLHFKAWFWTKCSCRILKSRAKILTSF